MKPNDARYRQHQEYEISSNRYVVFEELISIAIDSFLIRKHEDASATDMLVGGGLSPSKILKPSHL
ncbi:hypothetical protein [Bradyrhizobium sp. USDA 4454]